MAENFKLKIITLKTTQTLIYIEVKTTQTVIYNPNEKGEKELTIPTLCYQKKRGLILNYTRYPSANLQNYH